jgi:hypothetical protein
MDAKIAHKSDWEGIIQVFLRWNYRLMLIYVNALSRILRTENIVQSRSSGEARPNLGWDWEPYSFLRRNQERLGSTGSQLLSLFGGLPTQGEGTTERNRVWGKSKECSKRGKRENTKRKQPIISVLQVDVINHASENPDRWLPVCALLLSWVSTFVKFILPIIIIS